MGHGSNKNKDTLQKQASRNRDAEFLKHALTWRRCGDSPWLESMDMIEKESFPSGDSYHHVFASSN